MIQVQIRNAMATHLTDAVYKELFGKFFGKRVKYIRMALMPITLLALFLTIMLIIKLTGKRDSKKNTLGSTIGTTLILFVLFYCSIVAAFWGLSLLSEPKVYKKYHNTKQKLLLQYQYFDTNTLKTSNKKVTWKDIFKELGITNKLNMLCMVLCFSIAGALFSIFVILFICVIYQQRKRVGAGSSGSKP